MKDLFFIPSLICLCLVCVYSSARYWGQHSSENSLKESGDDVLRSRRIRENRTGNIFQHQLLPSEEDENDEENESKDDNENVDEDKNKNESESEEENEDEHEEMYEVAENSFHHDMNTTEQVEKVGTIPLIQNVQSCRCQYPGELIDEFNFVNENLDSVFSDGILILLKNHSACDNDEIVFVCQDVYQNRILPLQKPDDVTLWSYNECPATITLNNPRQTRQLTTTTTTMVEISPTTTGLRGGGYNNIRNLDAIKRPLVDSGESLNLFWSSDPVSTERNGSSGRFRGKNPKQSSFAARKKAFDDDNSPVTTSLVVPSSSTTASYIILPDDHEDCIIENEIRLYDDVCTSVTLDFETSDSDRPLPGYTIVSDAWFQNYGIKVTTKTLMEMDLDIVRYPMVLDSSALRIPEGNIDEIENEMLHLGTPNMECNGPGIGEGGRVGQPGENCNALGNVLMLRSRHRGKLPDGPNTGILVFSFSHMTRVNSISLLNEMDDGLGGLPLQVLTEESGKSDLISIPVRSVGENGLQTIQVGVHHALEMFVPLSPFAAVTSLELCIDLPASS